MANIEIHGNMQNKLKCILYPSIPYKPFCFILIYITESRVQILVVITLLFAPRVCFFRAVFQFQSIYIKTMGPTSHHKSTTIHASVEPNSKREDRGAHVVSRYIFIQQGVGSIGISAYP